MTVEDAVLRFGRFELQPRERRLLRDGTPVPLPGKAFDLLVCLVEQAPRLVKKEELFARVWADAVVEDSNLNYTVSIVRRALGDGSGRERLIETVPRQGYRFAAAVERAGELPAIAAPPIESDLPLPLVQRDTEIETLKTALHGARGGRREVVFITGEAGIGKTSLVERFLKGVRRQGGAVIARGQCVEHRGEAEAYMPVLEALGRLGRETGGEAIAGTLERFAPTWLVQMPGLVGRDQLAALQERLHGQTRERMLREIDEALVFATAATPLVLVLEDLHWSDLSTIDLVARIARGLDPARLLVIGTYRSADALASSHPLHALVQELQLRGACRQLPLAPLSRPSVAAYLRERFGDAVPAAIADLIHQRTEGSPLFIAALIESWCARGILVRQDGAWRWRSEAAEQALAPPESLRAFLEEQAGQLPREDREVLEAAAVGGADFSSAIVASALERPLDDVEAACARLTRIGRFIRGGGTVEYPDGTLSDRYEFVHAFYFEVLYSLLPAGRRVRLHQQTAAALEALHGERSPDVAARLALHFVEARDARKAVHYLQLAAGQCLARSAPREAIADLEQALRMLPRIPDLAERREYELLIQSMLATALTATRGFSDAGAEAAYRRAYELARGMDTPRLFPIAFGLATMLELRGQYRESQTIMEEHLPAQEASGGYATEAHDLLACSTYHQGVFHRALQHALKGLEDHREDRHSTLTGCFGEHPGVGCCTWAALSLWFLGHADQALDYGRRAVALSEAPGHLYSLANARAQLACLHQFRREPADAERWAAQTIDLAAEQGFAHRVAVGQVLRGWARGAQGDLASGLAELERGLDGVKRIGMELDRPYYLALFAETLAAAGEAERALRTIDDAQRQAAASRSFFFEAELWRLRGTLLADAARAQEADDCFARAAGVASRQQAPILLLRAEIARARHGARPDGAERVRTIASLYASFREGLGTPDLIEAAAFIAATAAPA